MASFSEIAEIYPTLRRRLIRHPDDEDALHDWVLKHAPKVNQEGLVWSAARWVQNMRMKRRAMGNRYSPLSLNAPEEVRSQLTDLDLSSERLSTLTALQRKVVLAVAEHGRNADTALFLSKRAITKHLQNIQARMRKP